MVKNLEFQIYDEKMIKRPQQLIIVKEVVEILSDNTKCSKMTQK